MALPFWKTNKTLRFYLVLEAQTFIFAVLYQKKTTFLTQSAILYQKSIGFLILGSGELVWAGLFLGQWSRNIVFFFLFFLVQYITFGWNDWFFWYSTAKMKVWASKTNKTLRFYLFFKTADQFYWYSTAKIMLCTEKLSKTICFYWFL